MEGVLQQGKGLKSHDDGLALRRRVLCEGDKEDLDGAV